MQEMLLHLIFFFPPRTKDIVQVHYTNVTLDVHCKVNCLHFLFVQGQEHCNFITAECYPRCVR